MKTIYRISGIFMGCVVGVFLGRSIYTYYDYTAHPGVYETWSAPWYTGILRDGVIAAVLLVGTLAVRWIIRRKMKMLIKYKEDEKQWQNYISATVRWAVRNLLIF